MDGERGGQEDADKEPGGQVKPCDIEGLKKVEAGNSLGYLATLVQRHVYRWRKQNSQFS